MKKTKKPLSLFLAIALSLFTLAGCSTTDTSESAAVSSAADATETAGTTETAEAASAAATSGYYYSDGVSDTGFWENVTAKDFVKLCDYATIAVPSDTHEITDEAIQTEIDSLLADYTTEEKITDRAVADGDTVNIDYVGSVDGVEFDGGNTNGEGTEVTIGVTSYIDDFLEQLIGHMPGESFDVEVTFPDDYGVENLNGKDAVFAVTINYITETTTPELTDSFVSESMSAEYGWSTVAELKAGIESELQTTAISSYLQEYVVENTTIISLPESILEHQENSMVYYYQQYADNNAMELDEFLSTNLGVADTAALLDAYKEDNTEAANLSLVIQAIAEDAGITASDEDVTAYFKKYVGSEDYSVYEDEYGLPYLKMIVLNQNVLDYLTENAVLE